MRGPRGATPLHIAARFGQLPMVELLLAHGADAGARDDRGASPFDKAQAVGLHAVTNRLSLSMGGTPGGTTGSPSTPGPRPTSTPSSTKHTSAESRCRRLLEAAYRGDTSRLSELLAADARLINMAGPRGATALHVAARYGWPDAITMLLRHGADTTLRDERGNTPLHKARQMKQQHAISLLLAATPPAAATTGYIETPHHRTPPGPPPAAAATAVASSLPTGHEAAQSQPPPPAAAEASLPTVDSLAERFVSAVAVSDAQSELAPASSSFESSSYSATPAEFETPSRLLVDDDDFEEDAEAEVAAATEAADAGDGQRLGASLPPAVTPPAGKPVGNVVAEGLKGLVAEYDGSEESTSALHELDAAGPPLRDDMT